MRKPHMAHVRVCVHVTISSVFIVKNGGFCIFVCFLKLHFPLHFYYPLLFYKLVDPAARWRGVTMSEDCSQKGAYFESHDMMEPNPLPNCRDKQ